MIKCTSSYNSYTRFSEQTVFSERVVTGIGEYQMVMHGYADYSSGFDKLSCDVFVFVARLGVI